MVACLRWWKEDWWIHLVGWESDVKREGVEGGRSIQRSAALRESMTEGAPSPSDLLTLQGRFMEEAGR